MIRFSLTRPAAMAYRQHRDECNTCNISELCDEGGRLMEDAVSEHIAEDDESRVVPRPASGEPASAPELRPGLSLCLTLLCDELEGAEDELERVRRIFDHDDEPVSFTLEHNVWCPASPSNTFTGGCACGLADTMDRARTQSDAVARVRAELLRLAKSVQS